MRAAALWCAVLLVSCTRQKTDPRIFETKAPAHVTVRNIDAPKPVDCSTATTWREEFSCRVTPAPRIGCSYVEVGHDADAPLVRLTAPSTPECAKLGGARKLLMYAPASRASIEFDNLSSRAVLKADAAEWVLFLHHGQLIEARSTEWKKGTAPFTKRNAGGVIWTTVDPVLKLAPSYAERFPEEDVQLLVDITDDAPRVLVEGLLEAMDTGALTPRHPDWERFVKRVDEAGRKELRDAMLAYVVMGEVDAVPWLEADPAVTREALRDAIVTGLAQDGEHHSELFDALFRLDPARAATEACGQLERTVLTDESVIGTDGYSTVLALIAKYKVKCPWVLAVLEQTPCDPMLRRLSLENEDDTLGNLPLATAAERARAVNLKFKPVAEMEDEEEAFVSDEHDGWLLLAAAEVQGPFPDDFVKRNARRLYRRVDRFSGTPFDNPCLRTSTPPAEWACRMPLWLTAAEHEGCRIELDDAARTLTATGQPGYVRKQPGDE